MMSQNEAGLKNTVLWALLHCIKPLERGVLKPVLTEIKMPVRYSKIHTPYHALLSSTIYAFLLLKEIRSLQTSGRLPSKQENP